MLFRDHRDASLGVFRVQISGPAQTGVDDGLARFVGWVIQPLPDLGQKARDRRGDAPPIFSFADHLDMLFANDHRIARHHVEPCGPSGRFIAGEVWGDFRVVVTKRFERSDYLLVGIAVRGAQLDRRDVAFVEVVELERCAYGVALFVGQAVDLDCYASSVRTGRTCEEDDRQRYRTCIRWHCYKHATNGRVRP